MTLVPSSPASRRPRAPRRAPGPRRAARRRASPGPRGALTSTTGGLRATEPAGVRAARTTLGVRAVGGVGEEDRVGVVRIVANGVSNGVWSGVSRKRFEEAFRGQASPPGATARRALVPRVAPPPRVVSDPERTGSRRVRGLRRSLRPRAFFARTLRNSGSRRWRGIGVKPPRRGRGEAAALDGLPSRAPRGGGVEARGVGIVVVVAEGGRVERLARSGGSAASSAAVAREPSARRSALSHAAAPARAATSPPLREGRREAEGGPVSPRRGAGSPSGVGRPPGARRGATRRWRNARR